MNAIARIAQHPSLWLARYRRRWPGPGLAIQITRRSVQAVVLLLLFLIPSLSLYDNLRNQRDEIGIGARWDTATIHSVFGDYDRSEAITQFVRGSVWTMKIGTFVVSDPLAVVDFMGASRLLIDPFVLTALVPVALSLLLGRFFCGWICPADLLFEAGTKIRDWAGIRTNVSFARSLKYIVLGLGIVAGLLLGFQIFAEIYPPRIVSGELYMWITFGALGAGSWLFLTILAFEMFVSRRFWCRYVCPGGALYSLLGSKRIVRLQLVGSTCTDCTLCNRACEFGLEPMSGRFGSECNNCGLCVRACGHDALVWRISRAPKDGLDIVREAAS